MNSDQSERLTATRDGVIRSAAHSPDLDIKVNQSDPAKLNTFLWRASQPELRDGAWENVAPTRVRIGILPWDMGKDWW